MKQTYKQVLYLYIILLWVLIIFSFSFQNGEKSHQLSECIVNWITETLSLTTLIDINIIHFFIRKTAHFTEYFILGIIILLTLFQTNFPKKWIIGMLFCITIASLDESIQFFVQDRASQLLDVILDSIGSLCGILFTLLYKSIFYNIFRK